MPANLRVFLSSTCQDLFQERRDITQALLNMGHAVVVSEDPTKIGIHPNLTCVANCLEAIDNYTDLLLVVISNRYGSADDDGRSITMKEYQRAIHRGIPSIVFVRDTVWHLRPIAKQNPTGDLSPVVPDHRTFQFIDFIESRPGGKWLFPFKDAGEIIDALKFQISSLLRVFLQEAYRGSDDLFFPYVNGHSIMIRSDGTALRFNEYQLTNHTKEAVPKLMMGCHLDRPMDRDEFALCAYDDQGHSLGITYIIDSPNFKRWEVAFHRPLQVTETARFFLYHLACDKGTYFANHGRRVIHGIITYVFPRQFVSGDIIWELRRDEGWQPNIPSVRLIESMDARAVIYHYSETTPSWQFRMKW